MKRVYILPFLSLLLFSCDKGDESINSSELASSTPILIEVSQEAMTRGTMANDEADMGSVGLFCEYTGDGYWSSTAEFEFMKNIEYTYNSGNWSSPDAVPWGYSSITDKYSFNAYSPFGSDANGITASISNGEICINYIMPTTCANQPDLMIATPRKDIFPQIGGSVSLEFEHALAAIGFKVKGVTTLKLLSVTLKGISNEATLTHDGTSCVWSDPESTDDFLAGITAATPTSTTEANLVTTSSGYIMAIPQTAPSTAEVKITYCSTADENTTLSETLSLPSSTVWEASQIYHYTITLEEESAKITIELEDDWTDNSGIIDTIE